jgi:hypothetical protein
VLKVVLYGITQVLCYLIKYEKNKQLIGKYKYPFLNIFYRKVTRLFVRKTNATSYKLAGAAELLCNFF